MGLDRGLEEWNTWYVICMCKISRQKNKLRTKTPVRSAFSLRKSAHAFRKYHRHMHNKYEWKSEFHTSYKDLVGIWKETDFSKILKHTSAHVKATLEARFAKILGWIVSAMAGGRSDINLRWNYTLGSEFMYINGERKRRKFWYTVQTFTNWIINDFVVHGIDFSGIVSSVQAKNSETLLVDITTEQISTFWR